MEYDKETKKQTREGEKWERMSLNKGDWEAMCVMAHTRNMITMEGKYAQNVDRKEGPRDGEQQREEGRRGFKRTKIHHRHVPAPHRGAIIRYYKHVPIKSEKETLIVCLMTAHLKCSQETGL